MGLPDCHLRNRRMIIVGSPERRLSGSVYRPNRDCRDRTPFGIAASSPAIVWGCWNKLLGAVDVVITFRAAGTSLLGSLDIFITFRAAGTPLLGSLDIFITFRAAPEHHVWSRCTTIISISRRTSASSGVAPTFRQHLFCSSTTRLRCVGGR